MVKICEAAGGLLALFVIFATIPSGTKLSHRLDQESPNTLT